MLPSLLSAELAAARQAELIAAADAVRLSRRARATRRTGHRTATAPRRTWLRATQPTHI